MSDPALQCPACHGKTFTPLEEIDVRLQHRYYAPMDLKMQDRLTAEAAKSSPSYQLMRCDECMLEFCNPMAAPNSEWYNLAYQAMALYPIKRWEFDFVLNRITPKDRLFEIGCGSGEFMKKCMAKGISTRGADFAQIAVDECRKNGLDVSHLGVADVIQNIGIAVATTVTAFQVLEHLDHPDQLFRQSAQVSGPETTLWVAIPSHRRPSRKLSQRDYLDQPPHHMTRWTNQALNAVGERNGWSVQQIHFEPIDEKTALWWITTRSLPYRFFKALGITKLKEVEKLIRILLHPISMIRRIDTHNEMTGFTMMAEYRKKV